ncbi:hypothetical protein BDY24DRAFT_369920 [Mrakia frigida]|uniref:uncharacterized protein n=1 Tax=Mrakia frigida TaxID=29902 RepID=UPI003FCC02B6
MNHSNHPALIGPVAFIGPQPYPGHLQQPNNREIVRHPNTAALLYTFPMTFNQSSTNAVLLTWSNFNRHQYHLRHDLINGFLPAAKNVLTALGGYDFAWGIERHRTGNAHLHMVARITKGTTIVSANDLEVPYRNRFWHPDVAMVDQGRTSYNRDVDLRRAVDYVSPLWTSPPLLIGLLAPSNFYSLPGPHSNQRFLVELILRSFLARLVWTGEDAGRKVFSDQSLLIRLFSSPSLHYDPLAGLHTRGFPTTTTSDMLLAIDMDDSSTSTGFHLLSFH